MSADNLLSGLIGGLVVGVLGFIGVFVLVGADDRRWRAHNLAATRLVYYEVTVILRAVKAKDFGNAPLSILSKAVWEAEQSRVALILKPEELEFVILAYSRFTALVQNAADEMVHGRPVTELLHTEAGSKFLTNLVVALEKAQRVLARPTAINEAASSSWLGISGGGLVRLGA